MMGICGKMKYCYCSQVHKTLANPVVVVNGAELVDLRCAKMLYLSSRHFDFTDVLFPS
jgi:hypothetical protein